MHLSLEEQADPAASNLIMARTVDRVLTRHLERHDECARQALLNRRRGA